MTQHTKPTPEEEEAKQDKEMTQRAAKIARETLTGDVRDIILNDMKDRKNTLPWNLRGEAEQAVLIDQVNRMSVSIVERVVEIVAAGGRRTIRAQINKITIKDGIKAEIELSKSDEQRHELFDSQGAMVLIVIADAEAFEAERVPVIINKPQSEMFEDGGDAKKDAA